MIAVLLVSSGVALLIATRGQEANGGVAAKPSPSEPRRLPPSPTLSVRPSPTPVVASPSATPRLPSPKPVGPQAIARPPLTVLNNSTISGLGADAAARFRAKGWTIADVSGISGRYRYSTVYYDAGQIDAARELMRQFPAISVIEPRSLYPNLPGRGLTVVVTRDFA